MSGKNEETQNRGGNPQGKSPELQSASGAEEVCARCGIVKPAGSPDGAALPLRPHHGLCLGFFRGYGYSDSFSKNMASVLSGLRPDTKLALVQGCDCICAGCPKKETGCPGAAGYDRSVLARCRPIPVTWGEFQRLIEEKIIRQGVLAEICGDCQWADICSKEEYRMTE